MYDVYAKDSLEYLFKQGHKNVVQPTYKKKNYHNLTTNNLNVFLKKNQQTFLKKERMILPQNILDSSQEDKFFQIAKIANMAVDDEYYTLLYNKDKYVFTYIDYKITIPLLDTRIIPEALIDPAVSNYILFKKFEQITSPEKRLIKFKGPIPVTTRSFVYKKYKDFTFSVETLHAYFSKFPLIVNTVNKGILEFKMISLFPNANVTTNGTTNMDCCVINFKTEQFVEIFDALAPLKMGNSLETPWYQVTNKNAFYEININLIMQKLKKNRQSDVYQFVSYSSNLYLSSLDLLGKSLVVKDHCDINYVKYILDKQKRTGIKIYTPYISQFFNDIDYNDNTQILLQIENIAKSIKQRTDELSTSSDYKIEEYRKVLFDLTNDYNIYDFSLDLASLIVTDVTNYKNILPSCLYAFYTDKALNPSTSDILLYAVTVCFIRLFKCIQHDITQISSIMADYKNYINLNLRTFNFTTGIPADVKKDIDDNVTFFGDYIVRPSIDYNIAHINTSSDLITANSLIIQNKFRRENIYFLQIDKIKNNSLSEARYLEFALNVNLEKVYVLKYDNTDPAEYTINKMGEKIYLDISDYHKELFKDYKIYYYHSKFNLFDNQNPNNIIIDQTRSVLHNPNGSEIKITFTRSNDSIDFNETGYYYALAYFPKMALPPTLLYTASFNYAAGPFDLYVNLNNNQFKGKSTFPFKFPEKLKDVMALDKNSSYHFPKTIRNAEVEYIKKNRHDFDSHTAGGIYDNSQFSKFVFENIQGCNFENSDGTIFKELAKILKKAVNDNPDYDKKTQVDKQNIANAVQIEIRALLNTPTTTGNTLFLDQYDKLNKFDIGTVKPFQHGVYDFYSQYKTKYVRTYNGPLMELIYPQIGLYGNDYENYINYYLFHNKIHNTTSDVIQFTTRMVFNVQTFVQDRVIIPDDFDDTVITYEKEDDELTKEKLELLRNNVFTDIKRDFNESDAESYESITDFVKNDTQYVAFDLALVVFIYEFIGFLSDKLPPSDPSNATYRTRITILNNLVEKNYGQSFSNNCKKLCLELLNMNSIFDPNPRITEKDSKEFFNIAIKKLDSYAKSYDDELLSRIRTLMKDILVHNKNEVYSFVDYTKNLFGEDVPFYLLFWLNLEPNQTAQDIIELKTKKKYKLFGINEIDLENLLESDYSKQYFYVTKWSNIIYNKNFNEMRFQEKLNGIKSIELFRNIIAHNFKQDSDKFIKINPENKKLVRKETKISKFDHNIVSFEQSTILYQLLMYIFDFTYRSPIITNPEFKSAILHLYFKAYKAYTEIMT